MELEDFHGKNEFNLLMILVRKAVYRRFWRDWVSIFLFLAMVAGWMICVGRSYFCTFAQGFALVVWVASSPKPMLRIRFLLGETPSPASLWTVMVHW